VIRRGGLPNPIAGVLAIVIVALGCYLAFGGRTPWADDHEIHALVRGAPGLHSRTPVRIAGVDVGRVKSTKRGPGDTLHVTLAIDDRGLPIHRDAELKIRPRTFLEGNYFVDLYPGTPGAPLLEEGATIPVSATAAPVLLQDVGSPLVLVAPVGTDLTKATRDALKQTVSSLRQALDKGGAEGLRAAFEPAAPALLNFAVVAEALRGRREGDLAGAVDSTGRVAAAIPDQQLADLLTGLSRTARALSAHHEELGRSLPELDALLSESRPALASLNRLFPPARAFAIEARPGVRELPATLRLALPFLAQADLLLREPELPRLLKALDPSVAELARLEPPLARAFERVTPVTECLRRNALPTLKGRIDDPPLTTGEPVYRDLLYALVGQSSQGQNFDGNGPAVRYHAGVGDRTVTLQPKRGEPIVGLTSEPILGSRPRFTDQLPPFRPDVPCTSQDPPDLRAETGPAPAQGTASMPGLRSGQEKLRELLEGARR
jgi:ABC-type transporter Mla subunit MlaD